MTAPDGSAPHPTLILVTGRPGSGKSTLAAQLASGIGWPLVGRDEIFNGLAPAAIDGPECWERVARAAHDAFFDTLALLADRGVSLVADAAFQHERWVAGLARLPEVRTLVLRCEASAEAAAERVADRSRSGVDRPCHRPRPGRSPADPNPRFAPLTMPAPTIEVDTTDGCSPSVADLLGWIGLDGSQEA